MFVLTARLPARWAQQAARGAEPLPPAKMAMGCVLQSCGWLLLACGSVGASAERKAPLALPVGCVLLLTLGQLYIAPVGLALVSKCCPARARSTAVGFWFLAGGVGGVLAGPVGALYSQWPAPAFFTLLAAFSALSAAAFVYAAPALVRKASASIGDSKGGIRNV